MSLATEIREVHLALARNVLDRRRAQRLTSEQAAWKAQIAPRHWARIEAGKGDPKLSTIVKIALALGVAIGDLFAPVQP